MNVVKAPESSKDFKGKSIGVGNVEFVDPEKGHKAVLGAEAEINKIEEMYTKEYGPHR